jgi:signal transduction histidine kinase
MILGMFGPLAVVMALFAYVQYNTHRNMLLDLAARTTTDLGDVIEDSLQHAMLTSNQTEIQIAIEDIAANPQISNLFLLNTESEVRATASPEMLGRQFSTQDVGCAACHVPGMPHINQFSAIITLPDAGRVLRNCNPIENHAACYQCHDPAQSYNGVLITDLSLAEIEQHAETDLQRTLILLGGALLLGVVLLGVTMERLVIKPVGRLIRSIRDFDQGELGRRVQIDSGDEIGELAQAFNRMVDGLEQKARLEEKVRERTAELEVLYAELQAKEALREQLLKQVINAQEEERKRIARELHDELAQALTGLLMSLDTAESVLGLDTSATPSTELGARLSTGLNAVPGQLARTRDITRQALQQTRNLIFDLRPMLLDDLGLVPAIREYAESRLKSAGLVVAIRSEGEQRRLAPEMETALFRIAQEAMNNIVKHAAATHVTINLTWQPDELILKVADNGRGFDLEAVMNRRDVTRGMGLLGMRERATLLGGTLDIHSEPGQGTQVLARLMIDDWSLSGSGPIINHQSGEGEDRCHR